MLKANTLIPRKKSFCKYFVATFHFLFLQLSECRWHLHFYPCIYEKTGTEIVHICMYSMYAQQQEDAQCNQSVHLFFHTSVKDLALEPT